MNKFETFLVLIHFHSDSSPFRTVAKRFYPNPNCPVSSSQSKFQLPFRAKPFVISKDTSFLNKFKFPFICSYKLEMNDVQTVTGSTLGSTLPLVKLPRDEESCDYNPFEHRKLTHPTT